MAISIRERIRRPINLEPAPVRDWIQEIQQT